MSGRGVQAILLRPPHADAVAHVVLRVVPRMDDLQAADRRLRVGDDEEVGMGAGAALRSLGAFLADVPLTADDDVAAGGVQCSVGFTYRGLEALAMPWQYRSVFARLAPAFAQGAPLRAAHLGDSGASAPRHWCEDFALDNAHVLLTCHGTRPAIDAVLARWLPVWRRAHAPLRCVGVHHGARLGAPAGQVGQWVHFGFRDGLVEHRIAGVPRRVPGANRSATETLEHAAGEFLLGHPNNDDHNPFSLPGAPAEVRAFFHDSSFGVLRKMEQDVAGFQQGVARWQAQAEVELRGEVHRDWLKAKLCGRWPDGQVLKPGQLQPQASPRPEHLRLDFEHDGDGTGCPWGSHVRRMDVRGHAGAVQRRRSLLRRGMPYGPANWDGQADTQRRGLLGLFFCAGLEDQFEALLGLWANGPPPGGAVTNLAADPFIGQQGSRTAEAVVPMTEGPALRLQGFGSWTRTLGTAYAWHPGRAALARILAGDYREPDLDPWL